MICENEKGNLHKPRMGNTFVSLLQKLPFLKNKHYFYILMSNIFDVEQI